MESEKKHTVQFSRLMAFYGKCDEIPPHVKKDNFKTVVPIKEKDCAVTVTIFRECGQAFRFTEHMNPRFKY